MKKLLLAATSLLAIAGPALAADMPIQVPLAPAPAFSWTGCYAGAHIGGGWAHKDITDPVALVQDQISGGPVTAGVTTVGLSPNGYLIGGQFGCDYQAAGSNWVLGFEGAVSGANIKGQKVVALPAGDPGDQALVTARMDFIASGTVRLGYAWDRWLAYVKGGVAGASDKYTVVGVFQAITNPTPFNFQGLDVRAGWTAGGGVEWAFWENWSAKLEYDFYGFGNKSVLMSDGNLALSAPIGIKQTVQTIKLGLNFHMWSSEY
jgi:outer membrane immunogenic protein